MRRSGATAASSVVKFRGPKAPLRGRAAHSKAFLDPGRRGVRWRSPTKTPLSLEKCPRAGPRHLFRKTQDQVKPVRGGQDQEYGWPGPTLDAPEQAFGRMLPGPEVEEREQQPNSRAGAQRANQRVEAECLREAELRAGHEAAGAPAERAGDAGQKRRGRNISAASGSFVTNTSMTICGGL